MVKPSRGMQPDAVDLTKATRADTKAFHEDSFRNYMARKIHLQRQQFGLMLPPPPRASVQAPCRKVVIPTSNGQEMIACASPTPNARNTESTKRHREVRFAPDVVDKNESSFSHQQDCQRKRARTTTTTTMTSGGMLDSVLKRLKRRHGRGFLAQVKHTVKVNRQQYQQADAEEQPTCLQTSGSWTDASPVKQPADSLVESPEPHDTSVLLQASNGEDASDPQGLSQGEQPPQLLEEHSPEDQQQSIMSPTELRRLRPELFFFGVVVIVNGYTNPDAETLQRLLHRYGGDLEKYETARITHIIAEHLSTAKANIYKRQRKPIPVCKPSWITDCVQAQKLLPHGPYLIDEVRDATNPSQQSVASFFRKGSIKGGNGENIVGDKGATLNGEHSPRTGVPLENDPAGVGTLLDPDGNVHNAAPTNSSCRLALEATVREASGGTVIKKPFGFSSVSGAPRSNNVTMDLEYAALEQVDVMNANRPTKLDENHTKPFPNLNDEQPQQVILQHSTDDSAMSKSQNEDVTLIINSIDSTLHSTSVSDGVHSILSGRRTDDKYIDGRIRTVGTDPNFLESFFNSSRLSFIGSYKQRVRKSPSKVTKNNINGKRRFVLHVDMDCFFAQVALRNYPQYLGTPVAISHHGKRPEQRDDSSGYIATGSTSECATCNYEARAFGIKKGMFLGRAKQLCPDLIVLQYDFEGYEEVSDCVAEILHRRAAEVDGLVEQVSCDEAYMEVYHLDESEDPEMLVTDLATSIRQDIFDHTKCTATIGVATNKLLAKLATDSVKPNGFVLVQDYREILSPLSLKDLPGIGYRLTAKLLDENLEFVKDVWDLGDKAERELTRILGQASGKKILGYCFGKDDRSLVPAERKTIGAECSYGVRFNGQYGPDYMIQCLAAEVSRRMDLVGVKGSKITLKVKQRKEGAGPPPKFLGHGSCHNLSKSVDAPNGAPISDGSTIAQLCIRMFNSLSLSNQDVRGMGIVVSKVVADSGVGTNESKQEAARSIMNWFSTSSKQECTKTKPADKTNIDTQEKRRFKSNRNATGSGQREVRPSVRSSSPIDDEFAIELPPFSQIDMSGVEALPSPMRRQTLLRINDQQNQQDQHASEAPEPPVSGQNFRQTDVKRMLRLAAVKAGVSLLRDTESGDAVSLTQFEQLPLKIQLQLANDDESMLGKRSPHLVRKAKQAPAIHSNTGNSRHIEKEGALHYTKSFDPPGNEPLISQGPTQVQLRTPLDFFNEDLLPLKAFLDENAEPNDIAERRVVEFLQVCISEDRLLDASILLRSIKGRADRWSVEPFQRIIDTVNAVIKAMHGQGLDVEWITMGC